MRKTKLIMLFYSFLYCNIIQAQDWHNIKSRIIDSSGDAIAFAHVYIENTQIGTISNENGEFEIKCLKQDSIQISSVGYSNTTCLCSEARDSIILLEDILKLGQVTVNANKFKHYEKVSIGNSKAKVAGSYSGVFEAALFIPNHRKLEGRVTKLIFNLSSQRYADEKNGKVPLLENKEVLAQVKIYDILKNHFPDKNILSETLIIKFGKRQKKIAIDLTMYKINFPKDGLFISLEFLGIRKNNSFHSMESLGKIETRHFSPLYSEGYLNTMSFVRWSMNSAWEILPMDGKKYPNLNFGAIVQYPIIKAHNNR